MDKSYFKGKRVTVFGIGLLGGGVGTIKFLVESGAHVIATDIKTKEQLAPALDQLKDLKNVEYVLGQHRREDFTKVDMVIKTPQAPWQNKHIKLALEHNIPVEVDSSIFFKLCKNPIIGITGTKGKTTTARLIYAILTKAGRHAVEIGIGQTSVLDRLGLLRKDSVVVFELSSWRLSAIGRAKLSPQIAVFTNIFPDHLNYYNSLEQYIADKKFIYLFQKPTDWLVANYDDSIVRETVCDAPSQLMPFGLKRIADARSVFVNEGVIYLNNGNDEKRLFALGDIPLRGVHNISNVLAAIGSTYVFGIPTKNICDAIKGFSAVEHRLEYVGEVKGVRYYNDTTATIPQAAIAAIETFREPIILIAGGSDKELDFSEFGKIIAQKVKGVVLIKGKATEKLIPKIRENLAKDEREREFKIVDSIEKAVEIATRGAQSGDIILLSPGAASFGVFRNEFERGNLFKKVVQQMMK